MIIQVSPYNGMTREAAMKYWLDLALDVHKQMSRDNEFFGPVVGREVQSDGAPCRRLSARATAARLHWPVPTQRSHRPSSRCLTLHTQKLVLLYPRTRHQIYRTKFIEYLNDTRTW